MGNWTGNQTPKSQVNGGQQFEPNDAVVADDINACFNNSFYAVDFVNAIGVNQNITEDGGSPSVSFNTNTKKFTFSNLKGAKGDKGDTGAKGDTGTKGDKGDTGLAALEYSGVRLVTAVPKVNDTFTLSGSFNRTPVSGDYVNIICRNTSSGETYTLVCQVTAQSGSTATLKIVSLVNTRGADGTNGTNGTAAVVNGSTSNSITFSLSGTTLSITVG